VVVDKGAALPAVGGLWSRKRHGYISNSKQAGRC
jgi:hypothetical protein